MLIKKVVLENIRSYVKAEIDLPKGSVLLAGNIGSGKSTVLMAIDFALFGLKRGEMNGASLLRNGAEHGMVELYFNVDDNDVVIQRTLKRTKTGVSQDSGFIRLNGNEMKGTALELKQKVIELLNYPKDVLTKNDLLYKYTVYTSQEQMKQILQCSKDDRLNMLRKVFDIDKYERISNNAKIIISKIKERKKELTGYTADLNTKKVEAMNLKNNAGEQEKCVQDLLPKIQAETVNLENAKKVVDEIEAKLERMKELKKEHDVLAERVKHLELSKTNTATELEQLSIKVAKLKSEELGYNNNIENEIIKKKNELLETEQILQSVKTKILELKTKKTASEERKNKILTLNNCPTCEQEVKEEHKSRIVQEETNKIKAIEIKLKKVSEQEFELEKAKQKINSDLETLRDEEKKVITVKAKLQELNDLVKKQDSLKSNIEKWTQEINEAVLRQKQCAEQLNQFKMLNTEHEQAKSNLETTQNRLRKLELLRTEAETKLKITKERLAQLENEIKVKQNAVNSIEYLNKLQSWLEESFMPLMSDMEKCIMLKVHDQFNSLLSKWFNMLVNSETINLRLDEDFTPIIEQNGYEIDYNYLSGGEQTAAALAYRLSLNQVINNIMSSIKTRSLIILDEPTDGFSSEQLDNMRTVLDELNMSQVVIVSHEPKIESFVDNVIKFDKQEHVSKVLY